MKTINKFSVAKYQYHYGGDYKKSLESVEEFLEQKPQHKRALRLKGVLNAMFGNLPETILSYKQALSLCKPVRDFWERVFLLKSIGGAYWDLKEPELAITYYERALKELEHCCELEPDEFSEPVILTLLTLGGYQAKSGKFSDAIASYEKLLEYYSRHGPLEGIADVFYELGIIYYQQNDLTRALAKFLKVLRIFRPTNDLNYCGYSNYYVGCIHFIEKNFKEALVRIESSIMRLEIMYGIIRDEEFGAEDDKLYRNAIRLRNSLKKNLLPKRGSEIKSKKLFSI